MGNCNSSIHGRILDTIRKSDTMTWLICAHCKDDGKIEPVAWWESTQGELIQQIDDEELQKYV